LESLSFIYLFWAYLLGYPYLARDQPLHLFDAYTGELRASYSPYNVLDELESATVTRFHPHGTRLAASGFRLDRTIHVFDTATPGRTPLSILRLGKTRRSSDGQKGLVSALEYTRDGMGKLLVVGTYAPGSIYIYDDRSGQVPTGTILQGLCVVGHGRSHPRKKRRFVAATPSFGNKKHQQCDQGNDDNDDDVMDEHWLSSAKLKWFHSRAKGGVTQLMFAPDQSYILYSASRRSGAILSWDLRMLSGLEEYRSQPIGGIGSYETMNDTNQRLQFDLDKSGKMLFTGGLDKCVRIYDSATGERIGCIDGLEDAVNGVSCCKADCSDKKMNFIALATGSRRFPSEEELDSDHVLSFRRRMESAPGALHQYHFSKNDNA